MGAGLLSFWGLVLAFEGYQSGAIVARLVVPGHPGKMHEKALGTDAGEVVFDLEDAVAADGKAQGASRSPRRWRGLRPAGRS